MKKKIAKTLAVFFVMALTCNAGYAQNSNSEEREQFRGRSEKSSNEEKNNAFSQMNDGEQARRESQRGQSSFSEDVDDLRRRSSGGYKSGMSGGGFRDGAFRR